MTRSIRLACVVLVVALAGCSGVLTDGTTPTETGDATETPTPDSSSDGNTTPQTTSGSLDFEPSERIDVRVTAIVDGDTIDVRMPDGREETVRLVGVDTPEVHITNEPGEYEGVPDTDAGALCLRNAGHNATEYVEERLTETNVTLLFDPNTDRRGGYGRLLAYVSTDGQNLNYALVETGHARVYDTDFALRERFDTAEQTARSTQRGLWRCQSTS